MAVFSVNGLNMIRPVSRKVLKQFKSCSPVTDHMNQTFFSSMQSTGINFKLQMTPDGFTLIGDVHHLFNCTAGQTDTPAASSCGCCVGSVASVVSVGLNVPAPPTPCFTQSHLLSPTENPAVNHHKRMGSWVLSIRSQIKIPHHSS